MIRHGVLNPQHRLNLQAIGERQIKRMDIAIRVFAAITFALLALTIIFISLSLFNYIHPAACLISLGAMLPTILIAVAIHSCRKPVAVKHYFPLEEYDNNLRERDLTALRNARHREDSVEEEGESEEEVSEN